MNVVYTTNAISTGDGRDGVVYTDDAMVDLPVRVPRAMGGPGGGTNPEQLFASAYAACFHTSLRAVAGKENVCVPKGASVEAAVGIGRDGTSFAITATLTAALPGLDQAVADDLIAKAHQVCPYSTAIRGNVEVTLVTKV